MKRSNCIKSITARVCAIILVSLSLQMSLVGCRRAAEGSQNQLEAATEHSTPATSSLVSEPREPKEAFSDLSPQDSKPALDPPEEILGEQQQDRVVELTDDQQVEIQNGDSKKVTGQTRPSVLFDSYHAHNWLNAGLQPNNFEYHSLYGMSKASGWLKQIGWDVEEHLVGELGDEVLQQHDLLILNLMSTDLPPLMIDEMLAIDRWVQRGGGVLIIADHSNCYYHGYRLQQLLRLWDIETPLWTACDRSPQSMDERNIWISINRFAPHPITDGLREVAYQMGGTVDERHAIAFSGDLAWADCPEIPLYGEGGKMSLAGNCVQDVREATQRLALILGKQVGEGRVTIIADQNCLGDPFLHFQDNGRLWYQAVAWTAGKSIDPRAWPTYRDKYPQRVWCYQPLAIGESQAETLPRSFGSPDSNGLFHFFAWLNRYSGAFASSTMPFGSPQQCQVVIVDGDEPKHWGERSSDFAGIVNAGNVLVVLGDSPAPRPIETAETLLEKEWAPATPTPKELISKFSESETGGQDASGEESQNPPEPWPDRLRDWVVQSFGESITLESFLIDEKGFRLEGTTVTIGESQGRIIYIPQPNSLRNAALPSPDQPRTPAQAHADAMLLQWLTSVLPTKEVGK